MKVIFNVGVKTHGLRAEGRRFDEHKRDDRRTDRQTKSTTTGRQWQDGEVDRMTGDTHIEVFLVKGSITGGRCYMADREIDFIPTERDSEGRPCIFQCMHTHAQQTDISSAFPGSINIWHLSRLSFTHTRNRPHAHKCRHADHSKTQFSCVPGMTPDPSSPSLSI